MTRSEEKKFIAKFIFTLLFIYICLFEFIFSANRFLPKPTLLAESFISIWKDYDLLFALIVSISVVYISILIGYGFLYLLKGILCRVYFNLPLLISASKIFKYFPAFFYAVLFDYWFTGSYYAEFLFAFIAVLSLLVSVFMKEIGGAKEEYLHFAGCLRIPEKKIFSGIIWKSSLPSVHKTLKSLNYYLWVIILLFEFVADVEGMGKVYRQMLAYRDLSGLIAAGLIIAAIIYLSNKIIEYISSKIIHWENE